ITHAHAGRAAGLEAEVARGGARDVEQAVVDVGAAVVDAQEQGAPVGEVGDVHVGGQRQGRVRGRQGPHVEDFAVGGAAAVKVVGVVGGKAGAVVARLLAR